MKPLTEQLRDCPNRCEDVDWVLNCRDPFAGEIRDRINEMWETFCRLADPDFGCQFALHPNTRYWEMFLGYHFEKRNELSVTAPKPGPDLALAEGAQGPVLIEAVCLSSGEDGRRASLMPLRDREAEWWPSDQIALRYTSAIAEKRRQRSKWISKRTVEAASPYIIAINSANLGGRRVSHEDALSAVYPFTAGAYVCRIGADDEVLDSFRAHSPVIEFEQKAIPRDGFRDRSLSDVSGIIHCPVNWFWPYDKMVSETAVFANPTSAATIPDGTLGFGCRIDCRENGDRYEFVCSSDDDV